MSNKPYIYAGNLTDGELIKWLEERVLALKSLVWNRDEQALLKKHLADAAAQNQPITTAAYEGVVRPDSGPTPYHPNPQTQSETHSQLHRKETSALHQGGSPESVRPE